MIWKPKTIPTFNSDSLTGFLGDNDYPSGTPSKEGVWSETLYSTRGEFSDFLDACWGEPGKYGFNDTYLWREMCLKFQKDGRYCDFEEGTESYKRFWAFEKKKIGQGIIVNGRYIPGDFYFYLNYSYIMDAVKQTSDLPDCWDSDYHFYLYCMRADIRNLNAGVCKSRRKGYSQKATSMMLRNLWFIPNSVSKMIGYEEDYVNEKGSWKFLVTYRDHLNTHTPWYRVFEPDEATNWEQKETVVEGTHNKKKRIKGLRSKLMAATAKKNPSKAVGGSIKFLFCEEAGIFPNMDKVLEFADAATKMGGVKTGFSLVSGAVGELKDCKPLENIALKPEVNGFFGVDDIFSDVPSGEKICFFVPDYWNYITEYEGEVLKCFDVHGNSDIPLAQKLLLEEEEVMKKKDTYTLWKSQHPWNLQDAFAIREENIWPTKIIKDHQQYVRATYSPLCVDIIPDENDKTKLTHKISTWKPVNTLRVDPMKDNRGVVEIDELPVDNPKWGLYYAGVDPIRSTNTTTSRSLMSVYIWKATHMRDGKIIQDYPVARYTGRFYTWEETYETCMNLIKYYNARVAVESNVSSFTEWAISKGYGHYFMHRKEIHILNEMMPNSTITNEIGVRMEGVFKEKALEFGVTYVDEVISVYDKEVDGEKQKVFVYGVQRLKDVMLMEEMLKFNPKLNTDRIIAFVLGLMAARSNTNRSLIVHEDVAKDHRTSRQIQPTLKLNSNLSRITLTNHFTKR